MVAANELSGIAPVGLVRERSVSRRSLGLMLLAMPALAQGTPSPLSVVQAFVDALDKTMKLGPGASFRARFDRLAAAVDKAFDLTVILSVSVGARWASMEAAAKAELSTVFRTYTIASYVANFGVHDGEVFEIEPETRAVGADQVVRTRIVPKTGETIKLDYLMRQTDGVWRVVDVLADGTISRVAVQRSDFRALLGRDGNTAALLDSLRRKIADLSGGALT